jgi:hypothetical protein
MIIKTTTAQAVVLSRNMSGLIPEGKNTNSFFYPVSDALVVNALDKSYLSVSLFHN